MADETKPKRVRGLKEREAAFRAGFLAGLGYALSEVKTQKAVEEAREQAMRNGWAQVSAFDAPKRTRRKKLDPVSGLPLSEPNAASGQSRPAIIASSSSA